MPMPELRRSSAVSLRAGLLSSLFLMGACATTRSADPAPRANALLAMTDRAATGVLNEKAAELQTILDDAAKSMQSPGLAMVVQIGGESWVGVTGCEDEPCTRKMTPDAKFRVGSITKNFVGTAILQQVGEGKISLDDTLEKWVPNAFPGTNIDGKAITIRQLLNHTSGIESYTENEAWMVKVYTDPTHFWNAPSELLKLVRGAHNPPGPPFYYSNTNFILLGMISAKADGYSFNDWDKVIQRRFLDKLALTNSHIPAQRDVELGSTNRGYVNFYNFLGMDPNGRPFCFIVNPNCKNADADFTRQDMSNAWSAGEIISTVGDLTKWINAEVKGDLLTPAIRQQQRQFMPTCAPGQKDCHTADIEVGLAMFKQMRFGFIGHRGEIFGFNGTIQYLPQRDLTVVVLSNRTALDGNHVGPIPETVAAALFPGLESKSTPRAPGNSQLSLPDRLSHVPLPARFR